MTAGIEALGTFIISFICSWWLVYDLEGVSPAEKAGLFLCLLIPMWACITFVIVSGIHGMPT